MSIQEELREELKAAMKAKDKPRLSVIRQVESEIGVVRSSPGFDGVVDDDLYANTIKRYVTKVSRSREEFAALGERGAEQVAQLTYEMEYLDRWIPEPAVSADETREIVVAAIAELGVDDPKMAGRVIGHVMKSHSDLDGGVVNTIVREELGA